MVGELFDAEFIEELNHFGDDIDIEHQNFGHLPFFLPFFAGLVKFDKGASGKRTLEKAVHSNPFQHAVDFEFHLEQVDALKVREFQLESGLVVNKLVEEILRTVEFNPVLIFRNCFGHEFDNLFLALRDEIPRFSLIDKILKKTFEKFFLFAERACKNPFRPYKLHDFFIRDFINAAGHKQIFITEKDRSIELSVQVGKVAHPFDFFHLRYGGKTGNPFLVRNFCIPVEFREGIFDKGAEKRFRYRQIAHICEIAEVFARNFGTEAVIYVSFEHAGEGALQKLHFIERVDILVGFY